jgi:hypothetical protein
MYNPFIQISLSIFENLIKTGYNYFVIQRFEWPKLETGKGFLVTAYQSSDEAKTHASHLDANEGKMLDIKERMETIQALLAKESGYHLFLSKFKEENWKSRMTKLYKDKIVIYLRSKTAFTRNDAIDIKFFLEHGRVMAEISNGEDFITLKAVDLIS